MHHGWSGMHSLPRSSSLMKLTMRVAKMPSGSSTTTSSPRMLNVRPGCLRRNRKIATITPTSAPWKAMPPFQIAMKSSGWAR